MSFKEKMQKTTGLEVPGSYQIIGDVMLLKLGKMKSGEKKILATAILKEYSYVKTVCEILGVSGELRKPLVKKIAGNGTITIHREHDILYSIDVTKQMFSKGNLNERQRLVSLVNGNDIVVDMFAGIGYFSLGIAKHARKVIAIEKSKDSFEMLRENVKLNNIKNMDLVNKDCRTMKAEGKADRIIMGYFPHTEKFLPTAIKLLKKNGTIHFHNTYHKADLWQKPLMDLKKVCKKECVKFRVEKRKKVKGVAPNVFHIVMDVKIEKS